MKSKKKTIQSVCNCKRETYCGSLNVDAVQRDKFGLVSRKVFDDCVRGCVHGYLYWSGRRIIIIFFKFGRDANWNLFLII